MLSAAKKKHFAVIALFAVVAAVTLFYRIERRTQPSPINLNDIPQTIGEWRMTAQNDTIKAAEAKFLDDVLFRTYQRKDGKIIMLAVAYGADQRRKFSIHLPEVCYEAADFEITPLGYATMNSPALTLKQFAAKNPAVGIELVQYWIVLNGKVVTGEFDRKIKQAYYNFFGADSGGVMVRVSSFATNADFKSEYEMQRGFVASLYDEASPEFRDVLFEREHN
ncbi:MAG: EpsI family protein [Nitrospirae bacterium]|nr:MAG: EpsI family protein [Nitrospirota bacterium]